MRHRLLGLRSLRSLQPRANVLIYEIYKRAGYMILVSLLAFAARLAVVVAEQEGFLHRYQCDN